MNSTCRHFRVPRDQIAFLRFIFEAYDGIAVLRTLDSGLGVIALQIAPGCEKDVNELIDALGHEIRMEPWPGPSGG